MTENQTGDGIGPKQIHNCEHVEQYSHSTIHKNFDSAEKFQEGRKNTGKISTGSKGLDRLPLGGIETSALTEIHGASGSGKTQFCFTLCAMVQQNVSNGGLNGKAIYIDTEQKFIPNRIVQIAEARGFDTHNILSNILLSRPLTSSAQEQTIQDLCAMIEKGQTKLLIVDSIISHYRSEFAGRTSLPERQHRLYKSMRLLANIAEIYEVAVVVTNQVQSSHDSFAEDSTIPTGGNVMAYASTYRNQLWGTGYLRTAKLINSPYHPPLSERFIIYERGIGDDE